MVRHKTNKRRMIMSEKRNVGALVVGTVLICLGALTLFERLFTGTRFWGIVWPIMVIGFGVLFFVGMFVAGKSFAWLAIPGSIITVNGVMLFLQNLTERWETWSYSWTVILMSIGLGIFIMGAWQGNEDRRRAGLRLLEIGAILFVIFGAFFEILFSMGVPSGLRGYIFPGALILLGIYLIVKRSGLFPGGGRKNLETPSTVEIPKDPEIK
jgi:hypothetical protein